MKFASIMLTLLLVAHSWSQPTTVPADDAVRAATIAKSMRFSDADRTAKVADLTTDYLQRIRQAVDQRQAALRSLGEAGTPEVDKQTADAYKVCRAATLALRDAYVTQLNTMMTPYQVERIKDGLTDDWFHQLTQLYDEMVPNLTHAQRAYIAGLLTEMRENAMMEVDPERQRKWAEKYRGILNNYIAKQGHDFKGLAKAYEEKKAKP